MRRRGVLHIGVTGLAAMLAQGCAGGSGAARSGGGASTRAPAPTGSGFDPSAFSAPPIALDELRKLYAYDTKSFLDAALTDERAGDGVVVEDLTYSDTKGATIAAYVVTPQKFTGRLPAIVFAHPNGGTRDGWLAEAMAFARRGAIALASQVPLVATGDPTKDSALIANAVIAQRRGIDLLARRSDTDPGRIAFVGQGWGGMQAEILAGVEPRLTGVVISAGSGRLAQYLLTLVRPADPAGYLAALTRFDGVRYLPVPAKRAVLLQFGRLDRAVPAAQVNELVELTAGVKERADYDAGAELIDVPAAVTDRLTFLRRVLRLK